MNAMPFVMNSARKVDCQTLSCFGSFVQASDYNNARKFKRFSVEKMKQDWGAIFAQSKYVFAVISDQSREFL